MPSERRLYWGDGRSESWDYLLHQSNVCIMKYNGLRKYNSDNSQNETHQKIFEKRILNSKFKKLFNYLYNTDITLKEL